MAAYNRTHPVSPRVVSPLFIPLSLAVVAGWGFSNTSVASTAAASAPAGIDAPTGVTVADSASASPSSSSSLTALQAKSADSSVDPVGANVHCSYYDGPYLTYEPHRLRALQSFGVRHVRDQMAWKDTPPSSLLGKTNPLPGISLHSYCIQE
jgi:hypothetical protein